MHFPSTHPLIRHKVARLRDSETKPPEFRRLVNELSVLLAYEAASDLATKPASVQTPLGACDSQILADTVAIVPILRAGLGMAEGLLQVMPEAEVWHIGVFRDEATLLPTEYYNEVKKGNKVTIALVVDPMLATGGSAVHTCQILRNVGITRMELISLIAAPEGIARFSQSFPDVPIHVAAVDDRLTEIGYIYPGLGDAGDRQFATS